MPKPTTPPARRTNIISRRRLEESADRWWDLYSMSLLLFLENALESPSSSDHWEKSIQGVAEKAVAQARAAANAGLDAYEERWPGV